MGEKMRAGVRDQGGHRFDLGQASEYFEATAGGAGQIRIAIDTGSREALEPALPVGPIESANAGDQRLESAAVLAVHGHRMGTSA